MREGGWCMVHCSVQTYSRLPVLVDCFIPTASDLGAERTDFMQQLGLGAVSALVDRNISRDI